MTFIFGLTVMADTDSIRIHRLEGDTVKRVLAPIQGPHVPLRLTNGAFLRFNVNAYLGETSKAPGKPVLKVADEAFQYQLDQHGQEWVFRYEYVRDPIDSRHPPAHFHVRADLKRETEILGPGILWSVCTFLRGEFRCQQSSACWPSSSGSTATTNHPCWWVCAGRAFLRGLRKPVG
ncbi:MAG: hypothetical protein ABI595_15395, partial [Actinomycetota bacterium]